MIEERLPILEQCLSFNLVTDLMIEQDMSGQGDRLTSLSEEKLMTENITVKESLVSSLMLIALIRYKRFSKTETTNEAVAVHLKLMSFVQ